MSGFMFDGIINQLHQVLDLRHTQHGLSTSNLANSETPGYRARSIDFESALKDVFDEGGSRAGGLRSVDAHIDEVEAPPWAADGNSVLPERETSRLQSNALLYGAVAKGLSRRLAILRYAADDGS